MLLKERYEHLKKITQALDEQVRANPMGSEQFVEASKHLVVARGELIYCLQVLANRRKGADNDPLVS
jgi:hypothetical protein